MPDIPAEALAELITISTETGRAARSERHMVAAITAAAEPFGAIVVTRDPASDAELRDTDQRILERAALVLALHLLIKRSAAEAAERLGGDLLDDLLAVPLRHVSTLVERARRVGADLERPHVVVVVDLGPNDRSRSGFTAGRLAAAKGGLAGPHEGRLVLLLPGDDAAGAAQEVLGWFKDPRSVRITVGAGSPRASVAEFADGYAEAVRCLNALHALGRTGHAAALTDLGFVGLILGGVDPHQVVRRAIGPLIDYDAKRGTDLVGTVETYLFSGRSLGRTSAALHIHVNTVTQRLERVGRLLGADWQEPAKSLEVHLALQLRRVLTADPYGGQEWRDAR